ncbi:MAG: CusA/CzcA family heavy metal efflux transporter, partial [Verrucomicrobiales bacterium]|nr:CusA/CzcA family heavy metal efflux transporter [Verrucomicrobiales bacterium]
AALLLVIFGWQTATQLPVEVLPDMTKPTVTILTESPGLAPEEVETLVTQPIESAVQGVTGLDRLRSNSDVGLSLVFVEFAWGTDIYRARQMVQERLQSVMATLPANATPGLTPVSSLMGEIVLVGLRSKDGAVPPMDLRTLADWTLRRRLQSLPGVAEVLTIGGGVKQLQVQPDPARMAANNVTLAELEAAATLASGNATSGYLQTGTREIMVRNLAMSTQLDDIASTIVKTVGDRHIAIRDVATLGYGVQTMRGDASIAIKGATASAQDDTNGTPGVVLSIDKSPGFDTLKLTTAIERTLEELKPTLPPGVEAHLMFRQGDFISHAIGNLTEAIRDGAIMVTVVLLLFLLNLRTTFITLTAMPLSFAITLLVFKWFGVSVNSMTLGGLAVAIGMVVDDAIVDVENVFRRLRENASLPTPLPRLEVIARASGEVRNSILYATILIILVFLPLMGLEGLEGKLFTPIAIATITSMAASFVVSLTVIPVLCSFLLRPREGKPHHDGFLVRGMKSTVRHTFLKAALGAPLAVIGLVAMLLFAALMLYPLMGKEFLPTFNEGSATISFASAPGTSLRQSNEIGEAGTRLLLTIPEVKSVGRRAGRAEKDDHVMPVSVNEYDVEFREGGRPKAEVFAEIRQKLGTVPGTFTNVGQPIGHRLSHMLSGVSAKIAVKLFGPDLGVLRKKGAEIRDAAKSVPGLTDINLEAQVPIPQLRIEVDRERAKAYGLTPGSINQQVSTLIGGSTLTELREGQRTVDLILRLPDAMRDSPSKLGDLLLETPAGPRLPLHLVASLHESSGPNVINRENTQRRIVIGANTSERDLESLVLKWQDAVKQKVQLPDGYFLSWEGEYVAQQKASARIAFFFSIILAVVTLLLYGYFRSLSLALQVMLNIPLALMGSLALTWYMVGNISIATLVGFIAVGGVAARNGIMMISHYLHLMRHEGEGFTRDMIVRGTLERLVPVLMTALSAGIALVPLLLAAHEPGKELLHPVAVVIVGGLVSSTLLDLLVTPAVFYLIGRRPAAAALRLDAPAAQ